MIPELGFAVGAWDATLLALVAALLLDARFGEPNWLWARIPHPAALLGRLVDRLDRALNRGGARRLRGALALLLLLVVAWSAGSAVEAIPHAGPFLSALGAAALLAQRSLIEHVEAVAIGLRDGLAEGRLAVSRIVGRDPSALDEPAIARAAIESAAENFSDGVVAPAFWYLVGGLPAMLVYKAVNTADSMIGHRTERHARFGWAAARLDDGVNLVPARLSALLIAAGSPATRRALRTAWRDAAAHVSPNAGWPEAAMAGGLGVVLGGPRSYEGRRVDGATLYAEGWRDLGPGEIFRATRVLARAWILATALCVAALAAAMIAEA